MRFLYKHYILVCVLLSLNPVVNAQISSGDAFLVGDYVEVAISGAGGYEGSDFPLAVMHPRGGAGGMHGFVANPQLNNWASYDGDFFTPGTEENGWGLEFPSGINYDSNANNESDIPGSITSYTKEGDCITAVWVGNVQNVEVKLTYKLNVKELFYTTRVTLTNNSGSDLNNLYYYRNLDPDNNVSLSGDYSTTNTIVNQISGAGCIKSIVSAESSSPWDSYMALGAIGSDFRVTRGGFSNRDGSDIWNGLAGLVSAEGSSGFADEAISLAYKVNSLPAGDKHSFVFVVVLNETDVDVAISSLFKFVNDGVLYDAGADASKCVVDLDTIRVCGASSTDISLTGDGLGFFNWKWSPATYLSTTDGPSVNIINGSDITYTVTGTPIDACFKTPIVKTVRIEFTGGPSIDWTDPGGICAATYDLNNLVYEDLNALAGTQWSWHSDIPTSGTDMSNELSSLIVGPDDPVYLMAYDPSFDCFHAVEIDLDFINLSIKNSWTVDASCNANDGEVGVETEGVDLADLVFEWTNESNVVVGDKSVLENIPGGEYHLEITSTSGCDPIELDLEVLSDAITLEITGTSPICNGDCDGTLLTDVSGGAGNYSYTWDAGTDLNAPNQFGLCAGTYNLEVEDVNGCKENGTFILDEPGLLESSIVAPDQICENACDGDIDLTVTGGDAPYSFKWLSSNGDNFNTEDLNSLCGGIYNVEIEDANGCIINDGEVITTFGPEADFSGDNFIGCPPLITEWSDMSTSSVGSIVQWDWSFGDGGSSSTQSPQHEFLVPGNYTVGLTITTDDGCTDQIEKDFTIDVYPDPGANFTFSPEQPNILSSEVQFYDLSASAVSWKWYFTADTDSSLEQNPVFNFEEVGVYNVGLKIENEMGCKDSVMKQVEIKDVFNLYAPSAFTPNNDGINDDFRVKAIGFEKYEVFIYDRWGTLIFRTTNIYNSWDGRFQNTGLEVPIDTYVWKIITTDFSGRVNEKVGRVTVIK